MLRKEIGMTNKESGNLANTAPQKAVSIELAEAWARFLYEHASKPEADVCELGTYQALTKLVRDLLRSRVSGSITEGQLDDAADRICAGGVTNNLANMLSLINDFTRKFRLHGYLK